MTQSNEPQSSNSSDLTYDFEDNDPQPLRYPSLTVDGVPALHVSQISNMRSDQTLEQSTSSLLDSSYEVVEDPTNSSDNDARNDGTDSLASFSESAPSDVSFEDTETLSQDFPIVEQPLGPMIASPTPEDEPATPSVNASRIDSTSTSRTITQSQSNTFNVRFSGSSSRTDMDTFLNRMMGRPDPSSFAYEIQVPEASSFLHLKRPFRISYHGPTKEKFRIVDKVAEAIAISSSHDADATMDIVPLPSSEPDSTSPQVTLIPSTGLQIIVDECNGSCCISRLSKHLAQQSKYQSLGMKEAQAYRDAVKHFQDCPCYDADAQEPTKKEETPDLAIFLHTSKDNQVGWDESSLACSMHLADEDIPTIDISLIPHRYPTQTFQPYQSEAPHYLVEDTTSDAVIGQMPLDLKTFLALDAETLNKNLALITDLDSNPTYEKDYVFSTVFPWMDVVKGFKFGFSETVTNPSKRKKAANKPVGWKIGLFLFYAVATSLMLLLWVTVGLGIASLGGNRTTEAPQTMITNVTNVSALTPVRSMNIPGAILNPLKSYRPSMPPEMDFPPVIPISETVFAPFVPSSANRWPRGVEVEIVQDENYRPYFSATKTFIRRKTNDVWFKASTYGKELNASLTKVNQTLFEVDFGNPNQKFGTVDLSLWLQGMPEIIWKLERHHKSTPISSIGRSLWDIRKAFQESKFPERLVLGQTLGYNMLTRAVQQVNGFARGTSAQFSGLRVHLKEEIVETTKSLSKLADEWGPRMKKLARYPNPIAKAARKELIRVTQELTPYVDAVKETLLINTAALRHKSKSLQLRERFFFQFRKAKDRATSLAKRVSAPEVVDFAPALVAGQEVVDRSEEVRDGEPSVILF